MGVIFSFISRQLISNHCSRNKALIKKFYKKFYKAKICLIFSEEECKIIVHTFIISRLDNCNVPILYGIHGETLYILQRVQNYAARLIMRFVKMSTLLLYYVISIGSCTVQLQWILKFCFILIKHFIIMDLLTLVKYEPRRTLSSNSKCMLAVKKTNEYGRMLYTLTA